MANKKKKLLKRKKKKSKCSTCGKIFDDNKDLAFREVKPKSEGNIVANHYCGCKGWD